MSIQSSEEAFSDDVAAGENGITKADLYRAAWASSLGSALEYYDFALYSLASALIFGPLFFPTQAAGVGLIASFATYFIGFAVRPFGGIIFGSLGDRLGRKFVLLATVLLMGLSSTLIGVLPTYASVGALAPILLILLRVTQGLGAGAEQAGAAVLMSEYAPRQKRGFFASLPFLGIQLGTILAALVYFLLLKNNEDVAKTWLWRLPFLASILIVGVAIYIRLYLKESPSFAKLEAKKQVADKPLVNLLRTSRKTVLLGVGLRFAENGGSSIYQALAISYIVEIVGIKGSIGALCLVTAATLGAVTTPVAGILSDRFGRVRVYRGFGFLQLALAFPVWWVLSRGDLVSSVLAISVALGVGTWGMFGVQGALLPELFGAHHRYIGVALAREVSAVIAGGIAPLLGAGIITAVVHANGGGPGAGVPAWIPIATYLALLTLATIVTTYWIPEVRGRDMDDTRDAADLGNTAAAT